MRPPRALRWPCHGVVAVWAVGLFAISVGPPSPPEPATAAVRPVPEPARPPEPLPPSEPATRPPVRSESPPPEEAGPRPVGAAELARGDGLLDDAGSFPALSFSYEAFASFDAYARAMTELGARFVVVERRQIVASLDLGSGVVGDFEGVGDFSPRARDYTGEPGLAPLARTARARFGEGAIVMMLVPRRIDAGLFGGIDRLLAERGEAHGGLREIRGRYLRADSGGVWLRLESAVRRDGSSVPVEAVFDLGQIVGKAAT